MSVFYLFIYYQSICVAGMIQSWHLTLEVSKVWCGQVNDKRVAWPLEIDKNMPRATQSDNTQLISVNLDRSPSSWNLQLCLIFSFPQTHTDALICTKVYTHFSVCWHIISGYAFCYYTSELVHAIRGH